MESYISNDIGRFGILTKPSKEVGTKGIESDQTYGFDSAQLDTPASKDPNVRNIQRSLASITSAVEQRVKDAKSAEELKGCGEILTAVAAVEKALPTGSRLTFFLTKGEAKVLAAYIGGAIILVIVLTIIGLKPDNLTNALLYWTTLIAILMGSQALPSITGKGGGSGGGNGGSGGKSSGSSSS
jgi:hypothetical protein